MYAAQYVSPVGKLLLICREDGLTGIWYDREAPEYLHRNHPILQQAKLWLDSYFRGENPGFDIPLSLEGTAFQKQVWNMLLNIPYGKTKTYGDIAREIAAVQGRKKMSAQAVGQAVSRNPISILIPCHRVVGAKGQLTGYAGGIERKIWLLHQEGQQIEKETVI